MKAVLCKQYGPPESLVIEDLPSPKPGPGEVVISVKAASVNFPDVLIIQNKYQFKPPLPFSPGSELAGVVKAVGTGLSGLKPGDTAGAFKGLTRARASDASWARAGGPYGELAFRSIAWRGRLLVVGFAAGDIPKLPLNLALLKGASIVGVFWGDFARREPKAFAESLRQLGRWYAEGKLKPHVSLTFPVEKAVAALQQMAARPWKGK